VVIDDFRRMEVFGSKKETLKGSQDKGFKAEIDAFVACITGKGPVPIPLAELFETTLVTFAVHESLNKGAVVSLDEFAGQKGLNCWIPAKKHAGMKRKDNYETLNNSKCLTWLG
jgi:hypothetical protein